MAYHIGDQLEVRIEKIVPNGLGMAFAEKLTIFVPLAAKGDLVAVELRKISGRTAFAAIIEIFEPSADRVEPPCKHFGECGGCDFQHISYQAQLEAKVDMIRDCLTRIGRIKYDGEIPVIASPREFGYRLRTQFHAGLEGIGFFRRLSHEIIDIEECPILTPEMNKVLNKLRSRNFSGENVDAIVDIEAAASGGAESVYSEDIFEQTGEVVLNAAGERFFFNARSFFQANDSMLDQLIGTAVGGVSGETAFDLYSGAGLFSVPLSKQFGSVHAVESNDVSHQFAVKNKDEANTSNLNVYESRVSVFLKDNAGKTADFVVIDPPRSGVKQGVLKLIAAAATHEISYVSCNPSTLARDVAILLEDGFAIDSITALDLFPQTHHVETVVRLKRPANSGI